MRDPRCCGAGPVKVNDPTSIVDHGAMSVGQWLAVFVTVGLNAMDGFDVLSISFASPGIAKDWGVDKATLGWVLSMELVGMGLGSVLLGARCWRPLLQGICSKRGSDCRPSPR
jgi:hypothetical protein